MNRLLVVLAVVVCAACGDSPTQPSNPQTPPPPGPVEGLVVTLSVKADDSGARDAVAGLSQVIIDASASTGPGPLTFSIDFGDGSSATGATARHVYTSPGTFTIKAEARDSLGRTASVTQQVIAKTLNGAWFHAAYNTNNHRVQIQRLEFLSQEGTSVRGVYKLSGAPDRAFTGTLTAPRNVQIVADTTTLEGVIPGRLNEEGEVWTLDVRGGSALGGRADFRPVVGEPTGAAPDADLQIRIDSFGSPFALVGLSPIEFDGSKSRGSGLSYFIEFGDDHASTEPRAIHPVEASDYTSELTARLTVVDRFGRVDTESSEYKLFRLTTFSKYSWWEGPREASGVPPKIYLNTRAGLSYSGNMTHGFGQSSPCSAILSGERDVRIVVPDRGIEYRGHITYGPENYRVQLVVTKIGGAENGRALAFYLAAY